MTNIWHETLDYMLTPAERIWIARAGAHACPSSLLTPDARWRLGVTDEAVARVLLAVERGTPIEAARNGRWFAPVGSGLNGALLSKTVQECIRTGLLAHLPTGELVPATVHLEQWEVDRWVSRCRTVGEGMGPKRVRLVGDPTMVDCLACTDRL